MALPKEYGSLKSLILQGFAENYQQELINKIEVLDTQVQIQWRSNSHSSSGNRYAFTYVCTLNVDCSDDLQLSRADMPAFMRVNHACYNVSVPVYYKSLTIKFMNNTGSLQSVVSELSDRGLGRHYLKYARRLRLLCYNKPNPHQPSEEWILKHYATKFFHSPNPASLPMDTFLQPHLLGSSAVPDLNMLVLPSAAYWNPEWDLVASLIARISRLEDFDFIMHNGFPVSVQQAIDKYHPSCRISIWWRQLVGYGAPTAKQRLAVDNRKLGEDYEFDLNLLHLQGLHNLAISTISRWHPLRSDNYDLDEMFPFIFMAPNLKHLDIQSTHESQWMPITFLKECWRNLAAKCNPTQASSLDSITLSNKNERLLLRLTNTFNMSGLKSLDIKRYTEPAVLAQLALAFPTLERLFISATPVDWPLPTVYADIPEVISAIKAFVPLKFLCIRGLRSVSSMMDIIDHHGISLQGLILEPEWGRGAQNDLNWGYKYPELTIPDITRLTECCPDLRELRLQIKRLGGSAEECEFYKALGGFSTLHSLVLDLHFDPRHRPVPDPFESTDIDPNILREAFINAATDKSLARSIWSLIWTSQSQHQRDSSRRLRNLRLIPFGTESFPPKEKYLFGSFARSFLVFCGPVGTEIQEINKEATDFWRVRHKKRFFLGFKHSERAIKLCHELWPAGSSDDWLTGWSSFPLQVETQLPP